MKLPKLFLAVFVAIRIQNGESRTAVTLYEHTRFGGKSEYFSDLDPYSYGYLGSLNDKVTSFKINYGSCVEIHMHNPPSYGSSNDWFWTMDVDFANVGSSYNDRTSSVKSCGKYSRSVSCPTGTFAKKMEWDTNSFRNGIILYCYRPNSLTHSSSVRTHGSGTLTGRVECTGIRGVGAQWHSSKLMYYGILTADSCQQKTGDATKYCGPGKAVTGIRVDLENRSNFVKSYTVVCSDVGDIESICRAHDKHNELFTCDASLASYPLTCTHAKTVGYGYKSSLSQEEWTERTFHEEFGFELGAAAYGLSANFKQNFGTSNTTGYRWSQTQENTFQREITLTVSAEAPPGCITKVEELVGECSFMQARPNYYRRLDDCKGVMFVTEVDISKEAVSNGTLVSKIPEKVSRHLEQFNAGNKITSNAEKSEHGDSESN